MLPLATLDCRFLSQPLHPQQFSQPERRPSAADLRALERNEQILAEIVAQQEAINFPRGRPEEA